jgi:hypothetical protein
MYKLPRGRSGVRPEGSPAQPCSFPFLINSPLILISIQVATAQFLQP